MTKITIFISIPKNRKSKIGPNSWYGLLFCSLTIGQCLDRHGSMNHSPPRPPPVQPLDHNRQADRLSTSVGPVAHVAVHTIGWTGAPRVGPGCSRRAVTNMYGGMSEFMTSWPHRAVSYNFLPHWAHRAVSYSFLAQIRAPVEPTGAFFRRFAH